MHHQGLLGQGCMGHGGLWDPYQDRDRGQQGVGYSGDVHNESCARCVVLFGCTFKILVHKETLRTDTYAVGAVATAPLAGLLLRWRLGVHALPVGVL
jgi:hypothetical protein